ncbi:homoserine O-acetyltransferase [Gammaproteobacteria bacterium]|nr:homoserine O-acetyltransferase [Gammaproteobacteria bacterium]MDA9574963.1 homoserine O-acetyltransferase [Gammaproteobacteria bacterium]MDC3411081.1 homoserine O-acetyltransferase [Gammaproteobacteria bacterium]
MKTSSSLIKFDNGIDLECGVRLDSFELMVETYGELNENKSNGILVCHAFSGNHHAAGVSEDKKDIGWWDNIIGPDKAVDTNKYFVVCSNNLGGCSGSSGPLSTNPLSKKLYGKDFPSVSVVDWVNSQKQLSDYFGIKKWHIVLGGSLGGMQALQWSISFPESLNKAGIFAAAAKSSTQNIAMNEVGREAIRKDKNFIDGDYLLHDVKPKNGLKTARMLGHITYSSEAIMDEKFGRNFQDIKSKIDRDVDYQVENYLQYKGEKFSDIFDANSYILMTKAMDGYDASYPADGDLEQALSLVKAKLLLVGFDSDWLYPPKRSKEIQLAAMNVNVACSCVILEGRQGHDSFLFASDRYVNILKAFIEAE